jgi:cysteine desulfurase/selenocysteine lyase
MNRRTFLKVTAASTALPALASEAFAGGDYKDDQRYWSLVRDEFPISRELLYFNNGTMGPSPRIVTDRVTSRIQHVDSTGDYGGDYEAVRKAIARVLNAESGDTIAFTHNVSEAISIVSSGLDLKAGDEVLLTTQEHAGNMIPWLARKKRDGIELKFISPTDKNFNPVSDDEFLQRVNDAITPRTRAMSIPHLTCTTGHLLPIKRLAALARSKNIWLLADGAHPPGMLMTDVRDLGVHAYASCGHKWLCGPKGIGFLYIAPDMLEHVIPTWSGAEADKYWDYDGKLDFLPTASRYDFATQNFALFDGLQCAIEYQERIGFDKIQARVQHLATLLRKGLAEIDNGRFRFLSPASSVTGLTTIKLEHQDCQEFANTLISKHKIRTRVVHEGKLEGNRFSVHIYTSEEDIARFVEAVKNVLV